MRNAYKSLLKKQERRDDLEDVGVRLENGVTLTSYE
jgi:hypothetical protein